MKKLLSIILLISISIISINAQSTTVYLVRHAEKDLSNPKEKNPILTQDGENRAIALVEKLKSKPLDFIYSTATIRTMDTARPIAKVKQKEIENYNAQKYNDLCQKILKEGAGKSHLIVGHSNIILEMIETLGGKRPIKMIEETDYDYFFTVKIKKSGLVKVKLSSFGKRKK